MDSSEYQLIKINYSDDDLKRIDEFNKQHVNKAFAMLKHNRDKLMNENEYKELDIQERLRYIQTHQDYREFCTLYPVVSKYIIAFGLFSKKAFVKYLDWKARIRPSDELRSKLVKNQREQEKFKNKYIYAVYVKYLYKEKMNHSNLVDLNEAYIAIVDNLNTETDKFFDLYDKEKERQDKKKELNDEAKKQKIISQLKLKLQTK